MPDVYAEPESRLGPAQISCSYSNRIVRQARRDVSPVRTPMRLTGVEMIDFKGAFAERVDWPDLLGLGKPVLSEAEGSVSRACLPRRAQAAWSISQYVPVQIGTQLRASWAAQAGVQDGVAEGRQSWGAEMMGAGEVVVARSNERVGVLRRPM